MTIGLWCNSQSQTRKTMLLSVASPKILVHAPERRLFHYWNECKTAIEAWWMLSICHTPSGISIRNSTKEGASMGMVRPKIEYCGHWEESCVMPRQLGGILRDHRSHPYVHHQIPQIDMEISKPKFHVMENEGFHLSPPSLGPHPIHETLCYVTNYP